MNKSTQKSRLLAARKEVNREEKKMEAGKSNSYLKSLEKFNEALREAGQ
jgi:hypothetical protein